MSDIKNNLNNDCWETKTGSIIPITKMKTSHIINTLNMINRNITGYTPYLSIISKQYIQRFKIELRNRKIKGFLSEDK